jgi:glycine/sarcosine N-methyltransferase
MVPMTSPEQPDDVTQFYDRLAGDYDLMTGFEGRFAKERLFFRKLVIDHGIRTAVDAGAGTGFHSLLLAQLGVDVTAIDLSPHMLAMLVEHAGAMGLSIRTVAGDLSILHKFLGARVDAVFAMGNTLAHLLTPETLAAVLASVKESLLPDGLLCAQILNYRRILATRQEVINIKEAGGVRFTRRYDYGDKLIRFTIVKDDLGGRKPSVSESVELYPLVESEIEAALASAGFTNVEVFGGIALEPYDPEQSKDLVVLATLML